MSRYSLHFKFCGWGRGGNRGRKIIFNLFADLFIPSKFMQYFNIFFFGWRS